MQNNLATDVIRDLKRKIQILVVLLVITSLLAAGLIFAYAQGLSVCEKCKEKTTNIQYGVILPEKEKGIITIQKRRIKDGNIYNIQSQPTRKQGRGLYYKSHIKSS